MDIAISLRYGGEPVNAEDCNQFSYLTMGLMCPVCKDVVKWVAPKTRVSSRNKQYPVKAHFSHYKLDDPILKQQCEIRVKNLNQKDLQKMASKAISQRAKYFQTWFWQVFNNHIIRSDFYDWDINEALFSQKGFAEFAHNSCKLDPIALNYKDKYIEDVLFGANFYLDALDASEGLDEVFTKIKSHPNYQEVQNLRATIDSRLHRQIVAEAINFLGTRRNYSMRRAILIYLCISPCDGIRELVFNKVENWEQIMCRIMGALIAIVPWANEFEIIRQGKALSETSVVGINALDAIYIMFYDNYYKTREEKVSEIVHNLSNYL